MPARLSMATIVASVENDVINALTDPGRDCQDLWEYFADASALPDYQT